MIDPAVERRWLQVAIAALCLVPIGVGIAGMGTGGAFLKGVEPPVPVDLDSHFRYLSGLLLGIGLGFAACLPRIERRTAMFAALGTIVIVGGLGRLASLLATGVPSGGHLFGLAMELGAMPLLILWQRRVARRCAPASPGTQGPDPGSVTRRKTGGRRRSGCRGR